MLSAFHSCYESYSDILYGLLHKILVFLLVAECLRWSLKIKENMNDNYSLDLSSYQVRW